MISKITLPDSSVITARLDEFRSPDSFIRSLKLTKEYEYGLFKSKRTARDVDRIGEFTGDDVGEYAVVRGGYGRVVINELTDERFFSRELGYPHHHRILQQAAIERAVAPYVKARLANHRGEAVATFRVVRDMVYVTTSKTPEDIEYRLLGRSLRPTASSGSAFVKGVGMIRGGSVAELASSRLTTFGPPVGTQPGLNALDVEMNNMVLFKELIKIKSAKKLEAYFLEAANLSSNMGNHPDAFDTAPLDDPIWEDHPGFEDVRAAIVNRPDPEAGKLTVNRDEYIWTSKTYTVRLKMNSRVKAMQRRADVNDGDVAKVLARYNSIGAAGQFTMTPRAVVDVLVKDFGVKYEGFGSPINVDLEFCSLMFDVDLPFGSMGPFSSRQLLRREGNWSINPPFILSILKLTMDSVESACRELGPNNDTLFFVLFPNWSDSHDMDRLTGAVESPYLVESALLKYGEFSFERLDGNPLYLVFGGGLVFSVFSPSGKASSFDGADMRKLRRAWSATVPNVVRKRLQAVKTLPYKEYLKLKAEGRAD